MTGSPDETVLWTVEDGVATLTLNRPDQLNALTPPMQRRWSELLLRADADPTVRVIVVTGAGRGFCVGADMESLMDTADSGGIGLEATGSEPSFAGGDRKRVRAGSRSP